jgi:predicted phosphodiesterase
MDSLSNLEKFKESKSNRSTHAKNKIKHPKGFEPSAQFNQATKTGEIVSQPQKKNQIDWKEQLESYFGKDAYKYKVVENQAEIRYWDSNIGNGNIERLYYFKAKIVASEHYMPDDDFKKLLRSAGKLKKTTKKPIKDSKTFCIALADFQIGKEGSSEAIDRFMDYIPKIKAQIKQIKKVESIDQVLFAGLGDLVESCSNHYNMQEFSTILDERQQQKVARRMIYTLIKEIMPLFSKGLVCFIGGNHGENRKNGKAYTTFADNKDVMLAEELQEIFHESKDYKKTLDFIIPDSELHVTIDVSDTVLLLLHGHQMRGAGNSQAKARKWLSDQAFSRNATADADIVLHGHYHYFSAYESSDRLILQAPTLDSGSEWFENTKGDKSRAGMLTFVIGGSAKWDYIKVIR